MITEIYILAIGFFLCAIYFMIVGFDKASKDIFIIAISIAILNILYCISSYLGYNISNPTPTTFYAAGICGSALSLLYIFMIETLSKKKLPLMKIIKSLIFVFTFFLIVDLIQSYFTDNFYYLTEGDQVYSNQLVANTLGSLTMSTTGMAIGGISIISSAISLVYILFGYRHFLQEEKYLKIGIYLSLVVLVNDGLVGVGDVSWAIPLLFIGYTFETLRLSQYLYDFYKNQRSLIISHIKKTSHLELTSDYTRIFIHDLKGLIRKRKDELSGEFKESIDNLVKMYSPTVSSTTSLHEVVETVLILFESQIEDKEIKLKKDLAELKSIDRDLKINSNIICSILYGLLNNALESIENKNRKEEITLKVLKKKDYIKFQVINNAPNLVQDESTNFPKIINKKNERGNGLVLMSNLARSQFLELTPVYNEDTLTMELLVPI